MSKIEDSSLKSLSPDDEIEYKSLSLIAVASLGLGLLSIFALLHTSLWVIPLLAVFIGLIARYRIKRNQHSSSGSGVAMLGIMLGLFFIGFSVSAYFLHSHLLRRQAQEFCDEWLELVKDGHLYKAYELTQFFEARRPPNANLVSLYGPIPDVTKKPDGPIGVQNEFKKYWSSTPKKELILFGKQASSKLRLVGYGLVIHEYVAHYQFKKDQVQLIYAFDYVENGSEKSLRFAVTMSRRWTKLEYQHWFVETVEALVDTPSDSS